MSKTFEQIQNLIVHKKVRISEHGYDRMAENGILVRDIINNIQEAVVIEDYPDFPKGSCVLALQHDHLQKPVHVVWGIPKGASTPAVIVTAYRPDSGIWSDDFKRRKNE